MAYLTYPRHSKSRVNRAGDAIRGDRGTFEDLIVLENWRASHAYIINTFQANIRRRTRGKNFDVGQRLKRRPTIEDKLFREPAMKLSRMHDVAGCRVVCDDIDALKSFRKDFHNTRALHVRVNAGSDRYDYIANPKVSGYRGIHDVYKYRAYSAAGEPWNDLMIEIQYRTRAQHAWATAVETCDLLTKSRGKFSEADDNYQAYFRCCSEIIARSVEGVHGCLSEKSNLELIELYKYLEDENHILRLLESANRFSPQEFRRIVQKKKNTILVYYFDSEGRDASQNLRAYSFDSGRRALDRYEEFERELKDTADIVLVKAEDADMLMKVFQNYFSDTRDFIGYVKSGVRALSN